MLRRANSRDGVLPKYKFALFELILTLLLQKLLLVQRDYTYPQAQPPPQQKAQPDELVLISQASSKYSFDARISASITLKITYVLAFSCACASPFFDGTATYMPPPRENYSKLNIVGMTEMRSQG